MCGGDGWTSAAVVPSADCQVAYKATLMVFVSQLECNKQNVNLLNL